MADWQCFCTTVNKADARECWVCGLRNPANPRAEAAPPAPAPARPRYPSPPPLPTAPAQAPRPSAPVPRAPSPRPSAPAPRAPSPRPSQPPVKVTQTQPRKKAPIDLTADSDDESPPKKPRMEEASRRGDDDRPMYREAGVPKEELKRRRDNENDRPLHRNVCREKVQDLEQLRERQRAKYDHPEHIPADPRCSLTGWTRQSLAKTTPSVSIQHLIHSTRNAKFRSPKSSSTGIAKRNDAVMIESLNGRVAKLID